MDRCACAHVCTRCVYVYARACMRACNFVQVSQVLAAALKEDRGERYQQVDQVLAAVQGWRRRYSLYHSLLEDSNPVK